MYDRMRVPSSKASARAFTPVAKAPSLVHETLRSNGKPLDAVNRSFVEQRFGHDFGRVRVHDDAAAAASAASVDARAYTVGNHVVLGASSASRDLNDDRATLAHELTHVVQQNGNESIPSRLAVGPTNDSAEQHADHVARSVTKGENRSLGFSHGVSTGGARLQRQPRKHEDRPTPYEEGLIEHARQSLPVLRQYVVQHDIRATRQNRVRTEVTGMRASRRKMDDAGDPIGGDRGAIEAQRMAKINRRPVSIDVTDTKVTFRVRFHVRFEDSRPESRFGELKSSLQQAIDTTWNQRLTGDALGGRKFEIVPDVVKVGRTSARDQNYWLITVRSADTGKIEYPGCTVEQPDPNAEPTSVTDPFCDGGVMSIPPLHIARPNILGHELLHFFGFVDRYREVITEGKDKKKHTDLQPTRVTGKRADPLAGRGGAPVLAEDLSMIFENLGVYDTEKMRGLDVLTRLEKQGMSLTQVQAEIARQQEILSTGHDPLMTPPPKKSFIDKTIKSVDDLPI